MSKRSLSGLADGAAWSPREIVTGLLMWLAIRFWWCVQHNHFLEVDNDSVRIIDIRAGMGAVLKKDEAYSLNSEEGAILFIVEAQDLTAHARAVSTPQRFAGATWPADGLLT